MQTEKQKMLSGALYRASDPELVAERARREVLLRQLDAAAVQDRRRSWRGCSARSGLTRW
jgi:hypothetical protein